MFREVVHLYAGSVPVEFHEQNSVVQLVAGPWLRSWDPNLGMASLISTSVVNGLEVRLLAGPWLIGLRSWDPYLGMASLISTSVVNGLEVRLLAGPWLIGLRSWDPNLGEASLSSTSVVRGLEVRLSAGPWLIGLRSVDGITQIPDKKIKEKKYELKKLLLDTRFESLWITSIHLDTSKKLLLDTRFKSLWITSIHNDASKKLLLDTRFKSLWITSIHNDASMMNSKVQMMSSKLTISKEMDFYECTVSSHEKGIISIYSVFC